MTIKLCKSIKTTVCQIPVFTDELNPIHRKLKEVLWISVISLFFVSFIIGVICFPIGCNKNITHSCVNYYIVDSLVMQYGFDFGPYCTNKTKSLYDCYKFYAVIFYQFSNKNISCHLESNSAKTYRDAYENVIKEFPLQSIQSVYVEKSNGHCISKLFATQLATIGLAMLCICCVTLLLLICRIFYIKSYFIEEYTAINTYEEL